MSERGKVLEDVDKRRIENLSSDMLFGELLDFAWRVTLSRPRRLNKERQEIDNCEAAVVRKVGLRGLRAALDIQTGPNYPSYDSEKVESEEDEETIGFDSPLRSGTDDFSDEIRPNVIRDATEFGQALLDEAYTCLGKDVHEKIRKFTDARSVEQQIEVINWLHFRLAKMVYKSKGIEYEEGESSGNETPHYHPARLSPRFIGQYPSINLSPTCLASSIVATSFFEQTGVDHLHAGVMKTRGQDKLADIVLLFGELNEMDTDQLDINPSQFLGEKIHKVMDNAITEMRKDLGYHACSYVRLIDGKWIQVDPNYAATTRIPFDSFNKELDEKLALLKELELVAPGLEASVSIQTSSMAFTIRNWLKNSTAEHLPTRVSIEEFLLSAESESVPQRVKELFVDPFFTGSREDARHSLKKLFRKGLNNRRYTDAFYDAFDSLVLWEEPVEKVLAQCQTDAAYLAARVEDIRALPIFVGANTALNFVTDHPKKSDHMIHALSEVGLPAARVGMSVLSDFAMNCDRRLPPSFWITNWSSLVPITETIEDESYSNPQASLLFNNMAWLGQTYLKYEKSDDIVDAFLTSHKDRGDDSAAAGQESTGSGDR